MIEVFFNLLLSFGIRVSGLAFALFMSKMTSDGFSSPFWPDPLQHIFLFSDELDFDVELARSLL